MPGRFLNILFLLLSLVKMVYKMAEEHRREPRWPEVEHAIRRNFGGLDEIDAVKVFRKYFRGQFSLGRSDTVGVLFSVTAKLVWFLDGMLCIPFRGLKCRFGTSQGVQPKKVHSGSFCGTFHGTEPKKI